MRIAQKIIQDVFITVAVICGIISGHEGRAGREEGELELSADAFFFCSTQFHPDGIRGKFLTHSSMG